MSPSMASSGLAFPAWSNRPEWGNSCGSTSLSWFHTRRGGGFAQQQRNEVTGQFLIHRRRGPVPPLRWTTWAWPMACGSLSALLGMVRYTMSGIPADSSGPGGG